jgi:hypothetical protein
MGGVILRRRPTPFAGALTLPKSRRLERMLVIERLLQSAASAIWDIVSELLYTVSMLPGKDPRRWLGLGAQRGGRAP